MFALHCLIVQCFIQAGSVQVILPLSKRCTNVLDVSDTQHMKANYTGANDSSAPLYFPRDDVNDQEGSVAVSDGSLSTDYSTTLEN